MMDSYTRNSNPFDMNKFFKPKNSPPNPIYQNHSPFPPPSAPTYPASYPPHNGPFSYPPQMAPFHILYPQDQQRSFSFHSPPQTAPFKPMPPLSPPPSANAGARLMALLNKESPLQRPPPPAPSSLGLSEFTMPANLPVMPTLGMATTGPFRMPSSKLPKGRHLVGDRVVYDVDVRLQGEVQPQLEVTPLTKYGSDPQPVLDRQIAVNKTYICYGLKQVNIRVLNINTALRSLLRGHTQVSYCSSMA